jgi:hypothetical protein
VKCRASFSIKKMTLHLFVCREKFSSEHVVCQIEFYQEKDASISLFSLSLSGRRRLWSVEDGCIAVESLFALCQNRFEM